MSSTQEKSKRGRRHKYGFPSLKKPGDILVIKPPEGEFFTPEDAKRISTAVYLHRRKHPFGLKGRVLSARAQKDKDGNITKVNVICLESSLYH
jgi:signal peptidase I